MFILGILVGWFIVYVGAIICCNAFNNEDWMSYWVVGPFLPLHLGIGYIYNKLRKRDE